ncbi:MAG: VWA domain-containing protein [Actinomycetota bacterium]
MSGPEERGYAERVLDAALLALSARIAVDETADTTPEAVITELWENHFKLGPRRAAPGSRRVAVDNAVQLPGALGSPAPGRLKPLARKPKRLDEVPCLYQAGGSAPVVVEMMGGDRSAGAGSLVGREPPPGGQGSLVTTETSRLRPLDDLWEPSAVDPAVRAMAERIARRLSIRRPTRDHAGTRGSGALESLPYRYGSDDIDLDRTLEVLTERPVPEDTDIIVRERVRTRRAVALLVDVSGSMKGEKIRTMAATVGALAADLETEDLALVAFWRDAALLKPLHTGRPGTALLDDLLRIPARGLTNVHFALTVGLAELARSGARQRIALLLSDCVHNAGPDPRLVARRFPRLHVLLQTDGEHDAALAADLARLGHGRLAPVRHYRQVAPALNQLLCA